jgi:hypothetical protein
VIAIAESLRRGRAGLATLVVVGILCFTVTVAHSGFDMDHMAPAEVVAMCLAITETAVVAVALATVAPVRPFVLLPPASPTSLIPLPTLAPPARAGPAQLQVFRL